MTEGDVITVAKWQAATRQLLHDRPMARVVVERLVADVEAETFWSEATPLGDVAVSINQHHPEYFIQNLVAVLAEQRAVRWPEHHHAYRHVERRTWRSRARSAWRSARWAVQDRWSR